MSEDQFLAVAEEAAKNAGEVPSSSPWVRGLVFSSSCAASSLVLDFPSRSSARDFTRPRMWSTRARYHILLSLSLSSSPSPSSIL
jgi:hypothetical protein